MVHARRKFVDAYESLSGSDAPAKSLIAIGFIGKLYQVESQARIMTATQRYYLPALDFITLKTQIKEKF